MSSILINCHSLLYVLITIAIITVITYVITSHTAASCADNDVPSKMTEDATPGITEHILAMMNASSISEFHRCDHRYDNDTTAQYI